MEVASVTHLFDLLLNVNLLTVVMVPPPQADRCGGGVRYSLV